MRLDFCNILIYLFCLKLLLVVNRSLFFNEIKNIFLNKLSLFCIKIKINLIE